MRVCLITYDVAHLKTEQVFRGLWNRGGFEIEFLFAPFRKRPEREVLFSHRPAQFTGATPREIARRYGLVCHDYVDRTRALEADRLLICGANILEPEFANSGKILNAHAGLIPAARGLDAFKWAVLRGVALGVTLHIIDEQADSGEIVAQRPTPVYPSDTIESLAVRHYETEIWMLQNFDCLDGQGCIPDLPAYEPTLRMPQETEAEMLAAFAGYRDRFAAG